MCVHLELKILGSSVKLILNRLDSSKLYIKILEFSFISLYEGKLLMVKVQNDGNWEHLNLRNFSETWKKIHESTFLSSYS
jgi:hypothetical protein